jgi:hypothetical protein
MNRKRHDLRGSGIVREWDSGTVGQCAIRLSAYRCPLPTGHCHSERSEESRCVSLVIPMPINTSRREDVRPSDDRHQTYCIPERKRVQAPAAPGFKASPGLRPWRPPVLPTERAGSEEVFVFRRLRRHLYSLPRSGNPQPSAHRAVKLKNPPARRAGQS